jgi:hypothetical protein
MMMAPHTLGINLLGARNSALQNLVTEMPPSRSRPPLGLQPQLHTATCTTGGPTMVALRHVVVVGRQRDLQSCPQLTAAEPPPIPNTTDSNMQTYR